MREIICPAKIERGVRKMFYEETEVSFRDGWRTLLSSGRIRPVLKIKAFPD